jgi:hypothetical protein
MPYFADRVQDVTTTTGTGSITLAGTPPTGYRTFATAFGSSSTYTQYCIAGATGEWEVGEGTFNGTTTLSRELVRSSSNSGSLVNFSAGNKDVFCTASAEQVDNSNIGQQSANARGQAWA